MDQDRIVEANQTVARAIGGAALGGQPKVRRYWKDTHTAHIALATAPDRPVDGVTAYATIGLSDIRASPARWCPRSQWRSSPPAPAKSTDSTS